MLTFIQTCGVCCLANYFQENKQKNSLLTEFRTRAGMNPFLLLKFGHIIICEEHKIENLNIRQYNSARHMKIREFSQFQYCAQSKSNK